MIAVSISESEYYRILHDAFGGAEPLLIHEGDAILRCQSELVATRLEVKVKDFSFKRVSEDRKNA